MLGGKLPLLAWIAIVASGQQPYVVKGTALYRERIAMPPGAVFEATLEDVSKADAAAVVLGRVRLEKPGQPPFAFSIRYDPTKIQPSGTYLVLAKVLLDGRPMFVSDAVRVLTLGKGSETGVIVMKRPPAPGAALGPLPATYVANLPCADCQGITYVLTLDADESFTARITHKAKEGAKPVDRFGRWQTREGNALVLLDSMGDEEMLGIMGKVALMKIERKVDANGKVIRYKLERSPDVVSFEPVAMLRGMFQNTAGAVTFQECATGRRFPVAKNGSYQNLSRGYTKLGRAGEPVLAEIEGRLARKGSSQTVVVNRYIGLWPGETCGAPFATSPLQETYWKLTRLGDQPVILAEKQKEPHLIFRKEGSRVSGFTGCNSASGTYERSGLSLRFGQMMGTLMACVQGMDTESAFRKMLPLLRQFRIVGEHLELQDATGKTLARMEARALR